MRNSLVIPFAEGSITEEELLQTTLYWIWLVVHLRTRVLPLRTAQFEEPDSESGFSTRVLRDVTSIQPSQATVVTYLKVPTHCSDPGCI